ncbi:MAG: hypothetical protein LBV23_05415 [Deltaproteobacteria bacterium]|jgi:hypothetical protein|nr:hypothetical protein [Deltaproteobacteria bacterium]
MTYKGPIYALFFLFLTLYLTPPLKAATISELFLLLPPEQVRGMTAAERRELIETAHRGTSGYATPSKSGRWLQMKGEHAVTLFGLAEAPIVYKIFPAFSSWQLLGVCKSRQTYGPTNVNELAHETPYDLTLFLVSQTNDIIRAQLEDYLPPISVLDFMSADTMEDKRAIADLAYIDADFGPCLTCHTSLQDTRALDILTVSGINGHSCAKLITHFKTLPLTWEKDRFTKPYDRAAPIPDDIIQRPKPLRGLYYREPSQ